MLRSSVEEAASVVGCGHANQLFEADYLDGHPQVHLHYLTDETEFRLQGYGRLEIVCHGCGASWLVLYDESKTQRQHIEIRDAFRDDHLKCVDRNFEKSCPDYRSSIKTVDMRIRKPVGKACKQKSAR